MSSVLTSSRSPGVISAPSDFAASTAFEIRREEIDWRLVAPGALEIEITIRNLSDRVTAATRATVRSAVFGAFVEQRPLTTLAVPPIAPRGLVRLTAVVPTAALATTEVGWGSPPSAPRVASAARDGSPEEQDAVSPDSILRAMLSAAGHRRAPADAPELRQSKLFVRGELMGLVSRSRSLNWMGNLNIFVGSLAAERHQGQALLVHPELDNVLFFHLGDRRPDAYRFHLEGGARHWAPQLFETRGRELRLSADETPSDWLEVGHMACMSLVLRPPKLAHPERAELHVQRRSSGQTAVVEFELVPR